MTPTIQTLLQTIETLPPDDQWTLIATLLQRTLDLDFPPLTNDELTHTADDLFCLFDTEEHEP